MNSDAKRILIADDESEIRAIVELLLRGEGYDVISVADGQAALDRAADLCCKKANIFLKIGHSICCYTSNRRGTSR